MKLQELIEDIWSVQLFGPILAILYSIEFQKRGLPPCSHHNMYR